MPNSKPTLWVGPVSLCSVQFEIYADEPIRSDSALRDLFIAALGHPYADEDELRAAIELVATENHLDPAWQNVGRADLLHQKLMVVLLPL